ncbi:MAG: hypothetical protein RI947_148 [Candidatus Parcubacteria bacterium]|jgi:DNA polymerase
MRNIKQQQIDSIYADIVNLKESPLYAYRTQNNYKPVIGEGDADSSIVFIGEAPGEKEALSARPFCGASGKVLDKMLASISLERANVYITNIVNDRPPENRDPTPQEIALYSQFLDRLLEVIHPVVIATLGRFSMKFILDKYNAKEKDLPISKLHGTEIPTKAPYGDIMVIPLYHPAVALYNPGIRKSLEADFAILKKYMK